jgi:hypothetical protein
MGCARVKRAPTQSARGARDLVAAEPGRALGEGPNNVVEKLAEAAEKHVEAKLSGRSSARPVLL